MATLAARLLALAQAIGADVKALTTSLAGSYSWTRVKLTSDFTTNGTSFVDVTGLSYTPPANSDFLVEADLSILTTTATTLPRVGVSIGAGQQWAEAEIRQAGAVDTASVVQYGGTTTAAALVQVPAGGLAVANSPRSCRISVKGRSGATPGPIRVQLAAEVAGANVCYIKAGAELRGRVVS